MNYLIYGTSYNLVEEEIKKIVAGKETEKYSLEDISIKELLENISYDSLFQTEKIIILKNLEAISSKKDNKDDIKSLEEYLKNPLEGTTLIFLSKEKISAKSPFKNAIKSLKIIETPIITKPYELSKIFFEFLKKEGYGISQNALNIFSEKCASNYDIAMNEFLKLKDIKRDNRLITDVDIDLYVSNYNTSDIFSFKDAIINRNIEKSARMIDEMEYSKLEIIPIVVMLAKEYITLYDIKLLSTKRLTNDQISSMLNNLHPYRVKLLRESSIKYTEEKLEEIILYLCNLDARLVSEDNLGYDELRKFLLLL